MVEDFMFQLSKDEKDASEVANCYRLGKLKFPYTIANPEQQVREVARPSART